MTIRTFREAYAMYRKNPRIRILVNGWWDGCPADLLLWRSRYMVKRLVERAVVELQSEDDRRFTTFLQFLGATRDVKMIFAVGGESFAELLKCMLRSLPPELVQLVHNSSYRDILEASLSSWWIESLYKINDPIPPALTAKWELVPYSFT